MRIGTKVICVDDSINPDALWFVVTNMPNWVKKGKKYVVRGFHESDIVVGVVLEEIHNPEVFVKLVGKYMEPHFALWRFAEIDEDSRAETEKHKVAKEIEVVFEHSLSY